jgi:hypothetical protein
MCSTRRGPRVCEVIDYSSYLVRSYPLVTRCQIVTPPRLYGTRDMKRAALMRRFSSPSERLSVPASISHGVLKLRYVGVVWSEAPFRFEMTRTRLHWP